MFKLHNPLIVIDLEATAGQDDKGFQTNNCVIDLGAVYLDEELRVKDTFSSLVKPWEAVTPFITQLTGITPESLEGERDFSQVGKDFLNWATKLAGNVKKVRLAAWGNYFDIPLLRKNYHHCGVEFPFPGTALDVKTLAFFWLSHSGRRTDKISLEFFAQQFEIQVEGRLHRALTDAKLTAEVLRRVWAEMGGFFVPGREGEPYRHMKFIED